MKTNNKTPRYRFAGYTEAWEQRKLGEIGYAKSGFGFPDIEQGGKDGVPFYKVSDMNNIGNEHELVKANNYVSEEQVRRRNWRVIDEVPAIFFAKVGAAVMLNRKRIVNHPFLLDNNTMTYIFKSGIWNSYFGITLFETIDLSKLTQVGALPSYNSSDVENISISLPSLPEQETIGTFFSTLDRLITLQQRKLDTLKEQKKTYLKRLFPAKGQTRPALRLKGFNGEWEEVKLGEVLREFNEKSEKENQFVLLSSTNIGIEPRMGRVSGESNIGYKIIKKGMIVLSPQNLWLGNINYNHEFEIGIVSPSYKIFDIVGMDELFMSTVIRLPRMFFEYAQSSVQGASIVRRNLDIGLFYDISISLPSLPEQEAIGNFFQTLDQEMSQVEDKLATLKDMKKTLLRNLFV